MSLTSIQAAAVVGCSSSHIENLARAGKLLATKGPHKAGRGGSWRIEMNRADLKAAVLKLSPRLAGRAEHRNGHQQTRLPIPLSLEVRESVAAALQWAALPTTKRELMLKIADRFNEAELDLIVTL